MGHNELGTGRYNQILAQTLAMEEADPAPVLSPELFANLVLECNPPEWAPLKGERRLVTSKLATASAAQYASVGLQHLGTAHLLVVIEKILVSVNIATNGTAPISIRTLNDNGTYDGTMGQFILDTPQGTGQHQGASLGIFRDRAATVGNAIMYTVLAGGAPFTLNLPFVLREKSELSVMCNTAQLDMAVAIIYRERYLEPSEKGDESA